MPAGVYFRALVSRLVTTWCSRWSSPHDLDRLLGQVELPPVAGVDDPRVGDRLDEQPGQVDRVPLERPAGVEPGQQQQVLDQRGHPRRLLLDLVERGPRRGGVVGTTAGQLGVAGDRGQRRPQLVGGVGDELAHLLLALVPGVQRRLDVGEQRVEGRADLADLGALVGEPVRHPLGELDVAGRQRQLGDVVRGRRDLAQRPQLAAYQDERRRPRRPRCRARRRGPPRAMSCETGPSTEEVGRPTMISPLGTFWVDDAVLAVARHVDVVAAARPAAPSPGRRRSTRRPPSSAVVLVRIAADVVARRRDADQRCRSGARRRAGCPRRRRPGRASGAAVRRPAGPPDPATPGRRGRAGRSR